jgi:putative DNA primase/helicase
MTIDAPRINGNGRHSIGSQSPIDGVLARLEGVRKSGGGFMARCPAHEDRTASLSVSAGNDGRVLLKCHAGCANPHIVAKIGLKLADLFPPRADGASFRPNSKPARKPLGRVVAIYDYRDADGVLVCQKIRHQDHEFRQRRPDGNGGWISNLDGVTKPLYRLPELLNAREDQPDAWIFICEGEKDADRCASEGLIATTNIGGAGNKWSDAYSDTLQGAPVVILVDTTTPAGKMPRRKPSHYSAKLRTSALSNYPACHPRETLATSSTPAGPSSKS